MTDICVGLVSPGEMGSAVAASLVTHGRTVVSVLEGRSEMTRARAREAGVEEAADLEELVARCEIVISIVPPGEAGEVAERLVAAVRDASAHPLVVEANALSPDRAHLLAGILVEAGAQFVDGDLIGGPPGPGRPPTRLYLSGPEAERAGRLLHTPELKAIALGGPAMAASSLKMAYAAWTKGSAALVLAARSLARCLGVEDALLAEWAESQPDLLERCEAAAQRAGRAWRFADEMDEIAASFSAVGMPPGYGHAAADIYRRLADFKGDPAPSVSAVLQRLSGPTP